MSFYLDEDNNKKQRLNLSIYAEEILKNDKTAFNRRSKNGFLNEVLGCYKDKAEASISIRLHSFENEMRIFLERKGLQNELAESIVEEMVLWKKEQLENAKKERSKKKDLRKKDSKREFEFITLQIGSLDYLNECEEEKYYASCSEYIKNLLEEYARLPYIEREEVIFSEYIKEINAAIKNGNQVKITTMPGKDYQVAPYEIMQDPLATSNYLVGYCIPEGESKAKKYPCSFKICTMKKVKERRSMRAGLTEADKDNLRKAIARRGVQFLLGEETEIKVRLSQEGCRKYRSFINLRPLVESVDGDIYTFHCTEKQAEAYFFKFGKDAEIIVPGTLRNKMLNAYKNAILKYE